MNKVLFTATVDSHIRHFHLPFMKMFKEHGFEVHVISCGNDEIPYCDVKYNVKMSKKPLSIDNLKAYAEIKKIIRENHYNLIHANTPICGALTRIASRRARKNGTKVIYTAHGFHFYNGSSLLRWILYYPIEKFLSKYTDVLIVINKEDYEILNKFKMKQKVYIPGVGVDLNKYKKIQPDIKLSLRCEIGFSDKDFIVVYVAELSKRKNQAMAIKAMTLVSEVSDKIKLLLVGDGELENYYKSMIEKSCISNSTMCFGYRYDVNKIFQMADLAISTSRQEGLPVNVLEAMASGLPLVVTDCRGNRDLVEDGVNGYVIDIDDYENLAKKICCLFNDEKLRFIYGNNNIVDVQKYDIDKIIEKYREIYNLKN